MTKSVCVLLALTLAGCTTSSASRMLNANTALISILAVPGPGDVTRQKMLSAAAKLARARGYQYFGVLALKATSERRNTYWGGPIGMAGPKTFMNSYERESSVDVTVQFLHENELPADRDGIYDVKAILPT